MGVNADLAGRASTRGKLRPVSEQPVDVPVSVLETLARDQHADPVADIGELRLDVWSSDQELEEFLVDWRTSRGASR